MPLPLQRYATDTCCHTVAIHADSVSTILLPLITIPYDYHIDTDTSYAVERCCFSPPLLLHTYAITLRFSLRHCRHWYAEFRYYAMPALFTLMPLIMLRWYMPPCCSITPPIAITHFLRFHYAAAAIITPPHWLHHAAIRLPDACHCCQAYTHVVYWLRCHYATPHISLLWLALAALPHDTPDMPHKAIAPSPLRCWYAATLIVDDAAMLRHYRHQFSAATPDALAQCWRHRAAAAAADISLRCHTLMLSLIRQSLAIDCHILFIIDITPLRPYVDYDTIDIDTDAPH